LGKAVVYMWFIKDVAALNLLNKFTSSYNIIWEVDLLLKHLSRIKFINQLILKDTEESFFDGITLVEDVVGLIY